jgi:hypothetical protein
MPMLTEALLNTYLNRHISAVCPNGFADDDDNHCAHFVNHVLNLSFGVNCRGAVAPKARKGTGSNLRVQETFARCPNVRELLECPKSIEALIFVSAPHNFMKQRDGTMALNNVPKKHIGLFLDGVVWHYSNSQRKVITQTLDLFIHHYPRQENALWVGDLPVDSAPAAFGT